MKIKICFFIFSLQFLLYSCDPVKYYQSQIPKYSDEVTVDPQNYFAVGFVLNIEDFQENENIYFIITLDEDDAKNDAENIDYMINFESTFDITEDTTFTEFSNIERKTISVTKNTRTSFYFQTTKENPNSNFLKFVIKSKTIFKSNIGFKNTEKDESEKDQSGKNDSEKEESEKKLNNISTILIIFFCVFAFIIILVVVIFCCLALKKAGKTGLYAISMDQQIYAQQMYTQPQIYGQQIYVQQMYGQQMNDQQQMIDQQGINAENNMNNVVQNK